MEPGSRQRGQAARSIYDAVHQRTVAGRVLFFWVSHPAFAEWPFTWVVDRRKGLEAIYQLNSTILSVLDRVGVRNVARQMRYFDAHVEQALELLLTRRCFIY